jgi:hypothetical protein
MENEFTRFCPSCGKLLKYKSYQSRYNASHSNASCRSCSARKSKPAQNPNKGKGYYYWWVKRYGKEEADRKQADYNRNRKELCAKSDFRNQISKNLQHGSGSDNTMYGQSVYDVWVRKYGKNEADKKRKEMSLKQSRNSRGDKNNMYGQPPPSGSGSGYSGWYRGFYFRSLHELSYIVKIFNRFGIPWESAESGISIPYSWEGKKRTYRADFLVGDKYLVEVKPKSLQKTSLNRCKRKAAEKFCKKKGWIYKMTCVSLLSLGTIQNMIEAGDVQFSPHILEKFTVRFLNEDKNKNRTSI